MPETSDKVSFSDFIRLPKDDQTQCWLKFAPEKKEEIRKAWRESMKLISSCSDLIVYDKRYSFNDPSTWPNSGNRKQKEN